MFLAAISSGVTAFLFKMRNREKDLARMGDLDQLRSRYKILAICNLTNINKLAFICYVAVAGATWFATALYLGLGSARQQTTLSSDYHEPQIIASSVQ